MNQLSTERRAQVFRCLVEGNSIRSTVRLTGAAKNTVAKLLVELGLACLEYQDKTLRELPCRRLQCDEIWSFCYAKEKNVPAGLFGDELLALSGREHHRSDKYGSGGMVYWEPKSLRLLASMAEMRPYMDEE